MALEAVIPEQRLYIPGEVDLRGTLSMESLTHDGCAKNRPNRAETGGLRHRTSVVALSDYNAASFSTGTFWMDTVYFAM